MARPSVAPRNLSLTEELEKLEQSITLTLQEIDQNFSKAHRIVTSSILPLVEQYGDNSRAVWEASKFWKQFFEASANVSLSGYEENNEESTAADESSTMRDHDESSTRPDESDVTRTPGANTAHEESMLDEGEITGSTPRQPSRTQYSSLESPYETMKREMEAEDQTTVLFDKDSDEDSEAAFAQRTARLISMTPQHDLEKKLRNQKAAGGKDPLLQRVLDKNYRIQTTPHKPAYRISPLKDAGPAEDSPMSSPEMAVPKLRSAAFMSPYKSRERTPGVSVQTPGKGKTRDVFVTPGRDEIDWESDEETGGLYAGMSPPKTIQFALPPSRLLQTPAREASKRIVEDILIDAGADPSDENSPTMVKMNQNILDDTF